MEKIDTKQLRNLILGTLGMFIIYCLSGVFHEYLIVLPYVNFSTGKQEILPDKAILVFVPTLVTWIMGNIYNRTLPQKTKIPQKNSIICGAIIFVSTITYTWATAMTSFPVVMAFKSCNILSILLVAVLCTRVRDKKLNLGPKKILIGVVISVGVFLFSYFDPQQEDRTQQSQILGIVLLFVSLLADGFLPDFQAQIKSEYKPQPTQMMQHINKWVAIISLVSMLISLTAKSAFIYTFYHPLFVVHLLSLSILSALGQFVVYTMIKLFKQHIVPFIITTRKILTVLISIVYYHHKTSIVQLSGMILVIGAVVYEFASQLKKDDSHQKQPKKLQPQGHIQLKEEQLQSSSNNAVSGEIMKEQINTKTDNTNNQEIQTK